MLFLPEDVFDLCLDRAKKLMGSEKYNSWLSNACFRSFNDGVFTIGLDSEIRVNFVTHNYKTNLEELLREVSGDPEVSVVFTHLPETLSLGKVSNSSRHELFSNFLKSGYVFDRFIQGPNNRLAFATAYSVACEMGHSSSNPLFIYGGVGLGKTHLIQAIAHHVKTHHPNKTFCYISSEEFLTMFLRAMIPNKNNFMEMENFKDKFRNSHYLIMDDVQFLSNKETTQDLFFHLFNDLYLRGRQIIVTSDRPPHELEPLAERLISRFQSGMVVDIKPPMLETRLAILNQKLRDENIHLDNDVVFYLAETVKSNVRQLEGAVNLLAANIRIQNFVPTIDNVRSIITEYLGSSSRRLNPSSITSIVGEYFGINPNALKGKKRKREILIPRQVSMFLLRDLTNLSLEEIGDFFDRDHSTVLNAIKRVNCMISEDSFFKRKILDIRESLLG
ncbi:MAG: chromosomal replication initiator protein DnaA [Candidatus Sabulitectum sp.]|nr:chromosomal replication initiator protein DnaA [Candidatus Sabulitectum sp.]